jgi:hypothetical protein
MSPILGIYASQISGHLITGAYSSIATGVGTGSNSVISFTSIPQTYTHLQIRAFGKAVNSLTGGTFIELNYNNDTGTNYTLHQLSGSGGGSFGSVGYTGVGTVISERYPQGNDGGSNYFGNSIIDILDYTNTNKYKTSRSLGGYDINTAGQLMFNSALWLNTSAISRIDVTMYQGNFATGSVIALYGIK